MMGSDNIPEDPKPTDTYHHDNSETTPENMVPEMASQESAAGREIYPHLAASNQFQSSMEYYSNPVQISDDSNSTSPPQGYPGSNISPPQGYHGSNPVSQQGYPGSNHIPRQGYPYSNQSPPQGHTGSHPSTQQGYPGPNQSPQEGYTGSNISPQQGYHSSNISPTHGYACSNTSSPQRYNGPHYSPPQGYPSSNTSPPREYNCISPISVYSDANNNLSTSADPSQDYPDSSINHSQGYPGSSNNPIQVQPITTTDPSQSYASTSTDHSQSYASTSTSHAHAYGGTDPSQQYVGTNNNQSQPYVCSSNDSAHGFPGSFMNPSQRYPSVCMNSPHGYPPGAFMNHPHRFPGSMINPSQAFPMSAGCILPKMERMKFNAPDSTSMQPEFTANRVSPPITPPPSRERFSYTRFQLELLNAIFDKFRYPNSFQKQLIAKRVGITRDQAKIWFQNRRRKDVVATGNNKKKEDLRQDRMMVSDHLIATILRELLSYEDDPKGKKLKRTEKSSTASGNRPSPYNVAKHGLHALPLSNRRSYREDYVPNQIAPGYNQDTSYHTPRRIKDEMVYHSSGSSSASTTSTPGLDISQSHGMTQLDMVAPPNAVAPSVESSGDFQSMDASNNNPNFSKGCPSTINTGPSSGSSVPSISPDLPNGRPQQNSSPLEAQQQPQTNTSPEEPQSYPIPLASSSIMDNHQMPQLQEYDGSIPHSLMSPMSVYSDSYSQGPMSVMHPFLSGHVTPGIDHPPVWRQMDQHTTETQNTEENFENL